MSGEGQSLLLREIGVGAAFLTGCPHPEALPVRDSCCQPVQWGLSLCRQWINR